MAMELKVDTDAEEVGFDAGRLERIDRHFARYVEEGAFDLTDPIARWLPEFAQPQVYVKGSALNPLTAPAIEPIRLWHLLTHTAGLTYGFHHAHPVDEMYRAAGFEWGTPQGLDLAACV